MKNAIIFEDEHLLIANKPSGIAAIPERNGAREKSFLGQLEKSCGQLFVVHRIDKQTSGAICFAKNESTHRALNILFETRAVTKEYLAVVKGKMLQTEGIINEPIAENPARPGTMKIYAKGKEALTTYEVEENFRHAALLRVKIHTGRMHQIRVHLKSIGYPLLIDEIYADTKTFFISSVIRNYKRNEEHEERPTMSRLTLHAASLGFEHPVTQQKLQLEAPLPKDFETLLKLLRKNDI
jgi:23S rRNA pseudouridine955/2504/2580 synthase/23S rRNA pseudouridine1911/1915/1917 synthase